MDKQFIEKVIEVQSKMVVPKTDNAAVSYKSRSAEQIQETAKPILTEAGLAISVEQQLITGPRIFIKSIATLTDGENMISGSGIAELLTPPQNSSGKYSMNLAQAAGATGSYSDKIALENVLGIGAGEDADHKNYSPSGDPEFHTTYITNSVSSESTPPQQIRKEHLSGAITDTDIDNDILDALVFMPKNLGIDKPRAKELWNDLYQQGIYRGKFNAEEKTWSGTKISRSQVPFIVSTFGNAAGKTQESIQAMTMQILGDEQVDVPTDLADYSDEPF